MSRSIVTRLGPSIAAWLEIAREASAEIALDQRPAERAHMIGPGASAVGAPEQPALRLECFGLRQRQEQLVIEAEWQCRGGRDLVRQRGHERDRLPRNQ